MSLRAFRYVLSNLILTPFVSAKAVSIRNGGTFGVILFVGSVMVCYWCGKAIEEGQKMIANDDQPMHYDCYREEQEAWAATAPPEDL